MSTNREMLIPCASVEEAKAKRDGHFHSARKRGEYVHRHVITDVDGKTIKYVVDKVIQRTAYFIGPAT